MMPDATSFPADAANACGLAMPQLPLAILIDSDILLLVGTAAAPPPAAATLSAQIGARPVAGRWRSVSWEWGEADAHAFLALVEAEHASRLSAASFAVTASDGISLILPAPDRLELEIEPLLAWAAAHGGDGSRIFDFVSETLGETERRRGRGERFLIGLLTAIAEQDGFVEIIAAPEDGGLLLQGWAMHLAARPQSVFLLGGGLTCAPAAVAHFHRSDLLPTASGFVAYLRAADGGPMAPGPVQVFFRSCGRYRRLDVVDNCLGLEADHIAGHLREMMGRLVGPRECLRALNRLCRLRFPGHETVSALPVPVRLACDLGLHIPGAGLFVAGWLLDPKRLVQLLIVKSSHGFYHRIENTMARSARPDVSQGFATDPLFAECLRPWDTLHGFLAFVPRREPLAEGEAHYLEVVLEDETAAFLPITLADGDAEARLPQILGSIDLDDPDIDRLIADHLSPLVAAVGAVRRPREAAAVTGFGPVAAAAPPAVSVIVPLGEDWADFDVNLAHFAADPDFAAAELIVVAPRPSAAAIAARLKRAAHFYGLGGRLVLSPVQGDRFEALALGAAAARAPYLLLLAPTVLPIARGWLGTLLGEAARLPAKAALCPTLLYEDHSIRFAGSDGPPAGAVGAGGRTGYAAAAIDEGSVRPVWAGVLDCCCLRADAFTALGGEGEPYVSGQLTSLAFACRLRAAGGAFYWAPKIALYALDEEERPDEAHWLKVRRLVDERSFQARWGALLSSPGVKRG